MINILIIPDVHGEKSWKIPADAAILAGKKIIFLGDYADGYDITSNECIANLKQIILLKRMHPKLVTLLLGNHDFAYVFNEMGTSGFDPLAAFDYYQVFQKNWSLFDLAWGYTNEDGKYTLFTHAGLTKSFYKSILWEIEDENSKLHRLLKDVDFSILPLHELLNYIKDDNDLLWEIGRARNGYYLSGSIVWADKSELLREPYPGINQVVGHTCGYSIDIQIRNGNTLYFTDNLYRLPLSITL